MRERALAAGVTQFVVPIVQASDFAATQQLCRAAGQPYALGIHPLYTPQARDEDLGLLDDMLAAAAHDPLLVAVGEIGLDFFVPGLDAERQQFFYAAQLKLAAKHGLPVILHVRRSSDQLLAGLRRTGWWAALRMPSTAAGSRRRRSWTWALRSALAAR